MRALMIVLVTASLLATPALAERTYQYSWDDDSNTILGSFDNCTAEVSASYNVPTNPGNSVALTKTTDVTSGFSTAFLACVWGMDSGDQVTASFWRYDPMPGYPRMRLWAHYNDGLLESDYRGQDLMLNDGLAYGNNSFGTESGWEHFEFTWTIPAGHNGLVIDAVLYGDTGAVLYLDEFSLTVPDHAYVRIPGAYYNAGGEVTAAEPATWSGVKALFE